MEIMVGFRGSRIVFGVLKQKPESKNCLRAFSPGSFSEASLYYFVNFDDSSGFDLEFDDGDDDTKSKSSHHFHFQTQKQNRNLHFKKRNETYTSSSQ